MTVAPISAPIRVGSKALPAGWQLTPLAQAADIIAGQSPPSEAYRAKPEGLPFFQGKADFGQRHPIARTWCIAPERIAEAGDILISVRAPVGPTNVADVRCCIGRGLAAIRPKPGVDRDFLLAAMRLHEPVLATMGSGSTFTAITRSQLGSLPIAMPPFEEQKRIAEFLNEQIGAVERARTAADARLEAASALTYSYLREAFQRITPLSAERHTSPAPKGWRWALLTDIARLESGHTPSRYHPEWWGGTIPWLQLPDIRDLDGKTAEGTSEYTNEDGLANSSARLLPADTVCLSRTASVGFVTIMGRPMATSQDFVNWVCGPKLNAHFLLFLLRASRDYIRSLSSGAVHKTVYMPTVKAFRVCVPRVEEQRAIHAALAEQLSSVERIIAAVQDQRNVINSLPAALLRLAFNGEL